MNMHDTLLLVGWLFLIASWTIPYALKGEMKRRALGVGLSGISVGVFLAGLIITWWGHITISIK
jgi:asparagine N-glycosylation enzyme membrane subunit Stt3